VRACAHPRRQVAVTSTRAWWACAQRRPPDPSILHPASRRSALGPDPSGGQLRDRACRKVCVTIPLVSGGLNSYPCLAPIRERAGGWDTVGRKTAQTQCRPQVLRTRAGASGIFPSATGAPRRDLHVPDLDRTWGAVVVARLGEPGLSRILHVPGAHLDVPNAVGGRGFTRRVECVAAPTLPCRPGNEGAIHGSHLPRLHWAGSSSCLSETQPACVCQQTCPASHWRRTSSVSSASVAIAAASTTDVGVCSV